MSRGSSIVNNSSNDDVIDKSSLSKNISTTTPPCVCNNNNIRKRVKSNSVHHCTLFPTAISSTSLVDGSVKDSLITCQSPTSLIIPESRDSHDHPVKVKSRNSMDDQTEFDIRRSWSHIEVRHLKGLFSRRNRHSSDVQRRNSYAYTTSKRVNQQVATESEYNVLNHAAHKIKNTNVVNEEESTTTTSDVEQLSPKKFPVDLFALQADMEREPDGATRSRQMRKFIISEIYSTEQSYLSHMKTLKKVKTS
jgi:hypothetical protein